ncbi:tRNA synthetases class II core domain (F)-domain-containing protein [Zopfochytrium polystomum]|nr:tRNA synthetases class II core domain (F)-domain-containing protein [Zopfochytrium polystomum]
MEGEEGLTHADLQEMILAALDDPDRSGRIDDTAALAHGYLNQLAVLGVLNSLLIREIVTYKPISAERWKLTPEGERFALEGSDEVKVYNAVPPGQNGISLRGLEAAVGGAAKFGQPAAFKLKWIKRGGEGLVRAVAAISDEVQSDLQEIKRHGKHSSEKVIKELKARKLIDKEVQTSYEVFKGPKFTRAVPVESTDITFDMISSGEWKTANFKLYNLDSGVLGVPPQGGHLHPLLKVREEFREIFLELGFTEMPTNRFVDSSFWNFDALFQPQQHPARDAHDTFFLKDPAADDQFPAEYMERVKEVHSKGGYGSIGYGYDWSKAEAEKLILRTHTTAVSSSMLYQLAQEKEFRPVKYFSIDRVFRNETTDATHLAEFHQVEGVVADRGLTLGDLIGVLHGFFKKLGIEKLRFKPAYNPYTEPSMEIFSWHEGLQRWVEIGNSGMFRPEMLLPLGLPEDVTVIAWGLSLERPTMIKYGYNDIRKLVGHRVEIDMVQRNPICRLDKKMGKEI